MGLLWSMKPVGGPPVDYWFIFPRDGARVALTVTAGNEVLASRVLVRRLLAAGVSVRRLRTDRDGIYGLYFAPASMGALRPGVLAFGGSEGGLGGTRQASLLASHGFPALAIAYFDAPGLPHKLSRVPLEYFARALLWLSRRPGVDPSRLVVMGVSRGSEAALLLGAYFPKLVHAVVALVPSNVVLCSFPQCGNGPAWTLAGRAVPFATRFGPSSHGEPDAVIPVERIAGPILLVCGGLDLVWPSCPMSDAIQARLRAHNYPYPHLLLRFPWAGHSVGYPVPYEPGSEDDRGSSAGANPRARAQAWPEILEFLAQMAGD